MKMEIHLNAFQRTNIKLNFSGKSSVLSAIHFGLGGSARQLNRGTSNRSYIKDGETSAWVEISLLNRGDGAYLPVRIFEL